MTKKIKGAGGGGGGKGGGGGSGRVAQESPDSLRSIAYASVLDLVAEGEIVGLANGMKSVFFNDTPLQNPDDSFNFTGATVTSVVGTQAQSYIQGFPAVENEIAVSTQLVKTSNIVRQITDTDVDAVRVRVSVPRLTSQNTTNGDISGTTVQYAIDVQSDGGGYVEKSVQTISGKTTSKYERSTRIELTGDAPWDIRVRRITDDSTSSALVNDTYFESYTEIIDGKFRYPNSAIIGVRIDASQFDNIPKRSYDLKLLKVKVPSNYNAETRVYTGVWDGTFQVSWTDNPAWCFYDLLTNERYGLGSYIDEAQVDKWTLYAISQYCDELVDDGFGGTEPRFTCNIYLQTRQEAYTVVNNMASIFRGMPYWASGAISVGQDAPSDAVFQYNNSNVIDGDFVYSGSALKARHTVALVTWNDPDDLYRQKVEYVEDSEAITRYGIVQTEVIAVGCTSRGQANRVGRWILYTEKSETELVNFKVGLDGNLVRPSDVIQIADQLRAGVRRGGRIGTSTAYDILLDQDLSNVSGLIGSSISVILPDGSLETRTISDVDGLTITVGSPFSDVPQVNSVWIVETVGVSAQLFKVISVSEEEDGFNISALEHDPNKYNEIENGLTLAPRTISALSVVPNTPANLDAVEALYELGSTVKTQLTLSWESVVGATYYEVAYKVGNNNFITMPNTTAVSVDIPEPVSGTYAFKVFAVNAIGKRSIPATLSQVVYGTDGLQDIDIVTDLEAITQSVITADGNVQNAIELSWTPPDNPYLEDYEIQWIRGSGYLDWGLITEAATDSDNYGTIESEATLGLDYGSVSDSIPLSDTGYSSRFTGVPNFIIAPASTGIEYNIRVRALNKLRIPSEWANLTYTSYGDVTPPSLIDNIYIRSGYKQLILGWTNPPEADFDYVELYRNITDNRVSAQKIGVIRGTSYVDAGLEINETYYYWAKSVDRSGNASDYTAMFAGTTAFIDSDQFSQEVMNLFSEAGAYGIEPVASLPATGDFVGQIKYDTTANKLYRWTGTAWSDDIFSITAGSVDIASFASGIEPVGIVSSLPNPSGYTGAKVVFLTTDNKLYRYTGSAWTSGVASSDLNGTLASSNFSESLRPVEIVATLPSSGNFVGRTAVLTTDGKLYRYTSTGWIASVSSSDISGSITNAQIDSLAASKVTGQLTGTQIADIEAAKVTGQLTNAQLADIAATKVTGTLTNAQIADLATTKLTGQITGTQITDNAISAPKIAAGSITTAKLAAAAVTADTISANAITSEKIVSGAIVTGKIAAGAISANEIATNAITAEKISAGSVSVAKIAAGAITADKISANAVTAEKIESGSITTAKIAAGAITALTIATDAITSDKIAANAVTASEISANAITAGKIAAGAVSATNIAADAITSDKIAANAVTASEIAANSVVAGKIAAAAVSTTELAANAITAEKIQAGAIIADKIAAGSIQTDKIAANAITGGLIAASGIITNSAQIDNGLITNAKIANLAVDNAKIANGTIDNAKLVNATITDAKIANAAITTAKIGDAQITSAKIAGTIQSDNFVNNTSGWQIQRAGNAQFNGVVISRNLLEASGDYGIGYVASDGYDGGLNIVYENLIQTSIPASSWSGAKTTYVALVGTSGTVRAYNEYVGSCQWGASAVEILPVTSFYGTAYLWVRVRLYARYVVQFENFVLTWKMYRVT